jgi:hypothetical protein
MVGWMQDNIWLVFSKKWLLHYAGKIALTK